MYIRLPRYIAAGTDAGHESVTVTHCSEPPRWLSAVLASPDSIVAAWAPMPLLGRRRS